MDNNISASQLTKVKIEITTSDQHLLDTQERTTPSPHELMASNGPGQGSPTVSANSNTKNKKLFPQKLWDLINDDKYNFCLRWSDDGQLVYLNRDDFEDSYLKTAENQFHTQKAISFVRQMNMYGFRKVDDCFYENDNFKRDCEFLLKNMIRKHPNKNPSNTTEITPYLYRNNQAANASVSSASSILQSSAAAASLLAPAHHHQHHNSNNHNRQLNLSGNFIDYRQRISHYPIYNSNKSQLLNGPNIQSAKTNNMDAHHQKHLLDEDLSNDSSSSMGDYCCSGGSIHGDFSLVKTDQDQSPTSKSGNHEFAMNNRAFDLLKINKDHSQQAMAFFPQLGSNSLFDSFSTNPLALIRDIETPATKLEQKQEAKLSYNPQRCEKSVFMEAPLSGSFNMNLKTANANALLLSNQDTTNVTDLTSMDQQHNLQSLCNNQKELIKALMAQQQSDTQYPRDLSKASSKAANNHDLNIQQSDNNNLNAFYALLSSLNSNLYQPSSQVQAQQNFTLDMNRYLQNIYQQILTTSAPTLTEATAAAPSQPTTITTTSLTNARLDQPSLPNIVVDYGFNSAVSAQRSLTQQQQQSSTARIDGLALHTPASDKDSSSTSLLARSKFSTNATKSGSSLEMFENGYRNGFHFEERFHEPQVDNRQQHMKNSCNLLCKPISESESLTVKRRDVKSSTANRSFKRSVDSILDSNNNSNINREHQSSCDVTKRIKIETDSEESADNELDEREAVNEYARNLVAQVAMSRDACIDPSVISEASRLALRFVETLFDTAQVIARHSNNSSSSADTVISNNVCQTSLRVDADSKSTKEYERSSAINLNDLTSALKLLPSKISKLLN